MEEKLVITIQDIADEVGVSRGTVDRVLNHRGRVAKETADQVNAAAERMGYRKTLAGSSLAMKRKKLQLGFIYVDHEDAIFHRIVYDAARQEARELAQYGVTVHFLPIREIREFQRDCKRRVQNFMQKHPEIGGWAAVGDFAAILHEIWEEWGQTPLPIVTYNMDIADKTKRLCYVGCDYEKAGRIACGLAALMTGEHGRVLIASEDTGDIPSYMDRRNGFLDEMKRYPSMEVVDEEYLTENGLQDRSGFQNRMRKIFAERNDIDVLYLLNPSDYSICDIVQRVTGNKKLRVITNDLVTDLQRQMLQDGRITATIDQEPERQGKKPLAILFRYLAMDREPEQDWYETHLSVIVRQNM